MVFIAESLTGSVSTVQFDPYYYIIVDKLKGC